MGRKERIVCVSGKLGKIGESWSEPVVTGFEVWRLPSCPSDSFHPSSIAVHNNEILRKPRGRLFSSSHFGSFARTVSNFTRVVIIRDGNIVPCQFRDDYTVKLCKFWTICSTIYLNLRACSLME
ncbi:unnamed protein product [Allacma fusca]|uniref:Uncharacterized protein n=1 Tax=Allacma fusca TaxID=39272 RepID=A0A8J2NS17_9HEXA|nr:unnamed protein product [Allacma fusca]